MQKVLRTYRKMAELVISAGLVEWLINKRS